jgi:hypothetical protein
MDWLLDKPPVCGLTGAMYAEIRHHRTIPLRRRRYATLLARADEVIE